VTPVHSAMYEELLERATREPHAVLAHAWRAKFLDQCGRFDPGHPLAESRDRAAWEDAFVRGGLARAIEPELADPAERELCRSLGTAHRGLFVGEELGGTALCRDLWSGAEFILLPTDDVVRELVATTRRGAGPLWQARLVATAGGCVVLPGAIFHPVDALSPIEETFRVARERALDRDQVLDALLRMEHTFRTLARVKLAYAYRPLALPA
jgi:hypothetical protein